MILLLLAPPSFTDTVFYYSTEVGSSGRDILRAGGSGITQRLTSHLGTGHYPHHNNPKLSPDGSTILFQSDVERHDRYAIWRMNVDGSASKRLTQRESLFPNWSPDGRSIVYSGRRDGVWQILIRPLSGGEERNVSRNREKGLTPGWGAACSFHPSGRQLVCAYIREKRLQRIDVESGESQDIGKTGFRYMHPTYSHDGKRNAVNRKKDAAYDLLILDHDGANPILAAENVVSYAVPAWSRDDAFLLFTGSHGGDPEIFRLRLKSRREEQLTDNDEFDAMPTW